MSLSDLVCQNNLHGRDLIVDGVGVPANQWETTPVVSNSEIFATGSVKGNVRPSNGPSQTGRPSGGGRGNNSPKSK